MKNTAKQFLAELEQEAKTTRQLLAVVPFEKKDFKPHPKSMSLERLAIHVAEMNDWWVNTLSESGLDFASHRPEPVTINSNKDLLAYFDNTLEKAKAALLNASDKDFDEGWTLRNGEQIYFTLPKAAVLRTWCLNHVFHHRGQLSVYLRLLDVPLPSIYGPTADMQG